MALNLIVVKVDGPFRSFNEAAEDEHLVSLGERDKVTAAIDEAFPGLAWSESGSAELGSLGLEVGIDEQVQEIAITLGDDTELARVLDFVRANGWHAVDSSKEQFIDLEA